MLHTHLYKSFLPKTISNSQFIRNIIKYPLFLPLLGASVLFPGFVIAEVQFEPLPYQDPVNGRNNYAYNAAIGKPANDNERQAFIDQIKPLAISAQKNTQIPACAIGGMAALESGYGFTRTAQFANNIFGIKVWIDHEEPNNWQLKGQPDEDDGMVKIINNYGIDENGKVRKECLDQNTEKNINCLVFKEEGRRDNRYRKFPDLAGAINYLAGTTLLKERYKLALDNYLNNRESGMNPTDACKRYIFDIVERKTVNGATYGGYSHIGGVAYLKKVTPILDKWELYKWSE